MPGVIDFSSETSPGGQTTTSDPPCELGQIRFETVLFFEPNQSLMCLLVLSSVWSGVGLEFMLLLAPPPKCWESPCPASQCFRRNK